MMWTWTKLSEVQSFFQLSFFQINHKYPERRLLVAEACGALAPYLPVRNIHIFLFKTNKSYDYQANHFFFLQKEIRSSLVLSMLQQMLTEDKADLVREAVIKSLGIIMAYIDDPDKYLQVLFCAKSLRLWYFFSDLISSWKFPLFVLWYMYAAFFFPTGFWTANVSLKWPLWEGG